MDWIRVDVNLRHHPKVRKLGVVLEVDRPHSYLIDLWSYCAQFARHGDLSDLEPIDIAVGAGWGGDPEEFVAGLVACGFLDDDDGGGLVVHDWPEHQGALIERRERDAERARAYRARQRDTRKTSRGRSRDVTRTSRGRNGDVTVTSGVHTYERTNDTDERSSVASVEATGDPGGSRPPADAPKKPKTTTPKTTKKAKKPNPALELVKHYRAEVNRCQGFDPVISWGKHAKILGGLLDGRDLEEAKEIITSFLDDPPEWFARRGLYDPEHILKAANQVVARMASGPGAGRKGDDPYADLEAAAKRSGT